MATLNSWDSSKPAGTDQIAASDDALRANFADLETGLDDEHYWDSGSADSYGVHKEGSARAYTQAAEPTAALPKGQLWHDTDDDAFYVYTGSAWQKVTSDIQLSNANTWSALQTFTSGITASQLTLLGNGANEGILYVDSGSTFNGLATFAGSNGVRVSGSSLSVDNLVWTSRATVDSHLLVEAGGTFTIGTGGSGVATGVTWSDLGTVTTVDINGGSIDGTEIGGGSASAITATTLRANSTLSVAGNTRTAALYVSTLETSGDISVGGDYTSVGTFTSGISSSDIAVGGAITGILKASVNSNPFPTLTATSYRRFSIACTGARPGDFVIPSISSMTCGTALVEVQASCQTNNSIYFELHADAGADFDPSNTTIAALVFQNPTNNSNP